MKKIGFAVLSVIFLSANFALAADVEKIAVAAEGKSAGAKVSEVGARAPYFLFFDETGKLVESADNPHKASKGGAGTSVAAFLAEKGATVFVAGGFGKNLSAGLNGKGIRHLEFKGSAADAVKKVLEAKN